MKQFKYNFIEGLRYLSCIIVILTGILAIIGSSDEDDDDGDSDSATLIITGNSGAQVELNGNWACDCQMETDGDSFTDAINISGASYSRNKKMWSNSDNCSGSPLMTSVRKGSFNLGEEVTATLHGYDVTASVVDVTHDSVEMTINDGDTVTKLNEDQFCGFNDWVAGQPKEILGSKCAPEANGNDLIFIDDLSDPDLLYLGDVDGPTDTNGYPAQLDAGSALQKN